MCNCSAEGVRLDVVGKSAPAVDLDDRDPLAVFRLQARVAGDVHLSQLERELVPQLGEHAARAVAEVAALGAVEDDLGGYG